MHFTPLYLRRAYVSVSDSGVIRVTLLAESWLSRVLSMENMHFASTFLYLPTKPVSSLLRGGDWVSHILACMRVMLPAFRASLTLSFFLREEHTYVVCTYGFFSPLLGALSVTSRFSPLGAPSTHAAFDLRVGVGLSPSMDELRGKKGRKKLKRKKIRE